MDSSSSGSMQSSGGGGGGGDEEFDSRGDSTFSAFLNSSTLSNQHPPPQGLSSQYQNHPSPLFDSLTSNYFDIFSQSAPPATPNSLLNLDMVLSRGSTSSTTTGGVGGGLLFSSPANTQQHHQQQQQPPPPLHRIPNQTSLPSSSSHETNSRTSAPADPSNNNVGVRNPKKRTRASRRAPTTVLTTDTSNFRAMVQEFTGIPPPPFAPSPFLGNRLNLFNTSSSSLRSSLESSLPYPLRPFAHKVLPPSFLTSMISSSNTNNSVVTTSTSTTVRPNNNSSSNNPYNNPSSSNNSFQLLSELGLSRQSESLTDMQQQQNNPMLTLQSHHRLQPSSSNPSFFGSKSQSSSVLDEFSLGHGQLNSDELGNAAKSLNDEWVQH
ncbi:hypothetical protein ACHQM5_016717 [Ranunculus cassubicifolius]